MIGHSGYVPQRVCLSFLECLSLFLSVPVVVSASAPSMHDTQYEFKNSRQSRNVGFVPTVPPRQEQDLFLFAGPGEIAYRAVPVLVKGLFFWNLPWRPHATAAPAPGLAGRVRASPARLWCARCGARVRRG